jgi:hypothetical protein
MAAIRCRHILEWGISDLLGAGFPLAVRKQATIRSVYHVAWEASAYRKVYSPGVKSQGTKPPPLAGPSPASAAFTAERF